MRAGCDVRTCTRGCAAYERPAPAVRTCPPVGFWARARAIKADLTRRIDRLGAGLYDNLAVWKACMTSTAPGWWLISKAHPAVRNVTLSNLGRLDLPQQYRNFRLERVYSPLVMVSPTPATRGDLQLCRQSEFAIISDDSRCLMGSAGDQAAGPGDFKYLRSDALRVQIGARNASGDDMKSFGLIFVLYRPTETLWASRQGPRGLPELVAVDHSPEADLRLPSVCAIKEYR